MARNLYISIAVGATLALTIPAMSGAEETCTKVKGTITCTSTEGPGKNQGGVGTTTTTTTQGNETNFSPKPQGTGQESDCGPNETSRHCR